MSKLENRIEKLERQTIKETGGREMLIKYPDGKVTRFCEGSPPFEMITLKVVYDQSEDERKAYEDNMCALFNGERTE